MRKNVCVECGDPVGPKFKYCSDACKKAAAWVRKYRTPGTATFRSDIRNRSPIQPPMSHLPYEAPHPIGPIRPNEQLRLSTLIDSRYIVVQSLACTLLVATADARAGYEPSVVTAIQNYNRLFCTLL